MVRFTIRRVLGVLPVLVIASFVVFALVHLSPGDPAVSIAGELATKERVQEIHTQLGFDNPLVVQYWNWLSDVIQGDFGTSLFSTLPVTTAISSRLAVTLSLAGMAVLVAVVTGIPLGLFAGLRQNSWIDRVVTSVATIGIAVPHFWLGTILVLVFALRLDWMPATGYVNLSDDPAGWLQHLVLPALALAAGASAEIARQTRSATISQRSEDYMRTAKAKGLSPLAVNGKHLLKNAAVPVITVIGLQSARLLGGAIIVEQVFGMPGLGQLAIQSVQRRDMPMIQGIVLFTAGVVVAATVLVDLSYGYFNPRVREEMSRD